MSILFIRSLFIVQVLFFNLNYAPFTGSVVLWLTVIDSVLRTNSSDPHLRRNKSDVFFSVQ